ncbi:MAG: hypothetical protein WC308_04335 [archaeon]
MEKRFPARAVVFVGVVVVVAFFVLINGCVKSSVCGDGVCDGSETPSNCFGDCNGYLAKCGNNIVESPEQCDGDVGCQITEICDLCRCESDLNKVFFGDGGYDLKIGDTVVFSNGIRFKLTNFTPNWIEGELYDLNKSLDIYLIEKDETVFSAPYAREVCRVHLPSCEEGLLPPDSLRKFISVTINYKFDNASQANIEFKSWLCSVLQKAVEKKEVLVIPFYYPANKDSFEREFNFSFYSNYLGVSSGEIKAFLDKKQEDLVGMKIFSLGINLAEPVLADNNYREYYGTNVDSKKKYLDEIRRKTNLDLSEYSIIIIDSLGDHQWGDGLASYAGENFITLSPRLPPQQLTAEYCSNTEQQFGYDYCNVLDHQIRARYTNMMFHEILHIFGMSDACSAYTKENPSFINSGEYYFGKSPYDGTQKLYLFKTHEEEMSILNDDSISRYGQSFQKITACTAAELGWLDINDNNKLDLEEFYTKQ